MTRWWIRHLLYSQLYYLWKSFGILLHMSGEVHSRGFFSKHWIMNDSCKRSWIKSQLKLWWVFFFLSSRIFWVKRGEVLAMQSDVNVPAFINEYWASLPFNWYQPAMRCRSHIYLLLQLLCRHYTASTALPLCRITLHLPAPKRRGGNLPQRQKLTSLCTHRN